MTRLWEAWQRFWFVPVSPAPLELVRTAYGVLVFLWALSVLPDAKSFFGPDGVLPHAPSRDGSWSVLHVWTSGTAAAARERDSNSPRSAIRASRRFRPIVASVTGHPTRAPALRVRPARTRGTW